MEPQIPMSKITTEAEWLGKMLLKLKDVKTNKARALNRKRDNKIKDYLHKSKA